MKKHESFPSNWLKVEDVKELTASGDQLVIRDVVRKMVGPADAEQKMQNVMEFTNSDKIWGLNATNWDSYEMMYGEDSDDWRGRPAMLYVTKVTGPNGIVDGVRVDTRPPANIAPQAAQASIAVTPSGAPIALASTAQKTALMTQAVRIWPTLSQDEHKEHIKELSDSLYHKRVKELTDMEAGNLLEYMEKNQAKLAAQLAEDDDDPFSDTD